VAEFLKKKERKYREPTYSYRNREFAVKFFSVDIGCVRKMRLPRIFMPVNRAASRPGTIYLYANNVRGRD